MKTAKRIIKKAVLIALLVSVVILITGIIYFEIVPENANINFKPADSQNVTDKTIKFNSDGKLKNLNYRTEYIKKELTKNQFLSLF